jgi:CcmD family protein
MLRRVFIALWSVCLIAAPLLAQPPLPEQQNQYEPVTGPPTETIPAAPLLIGAYIIVWLGLMGYLWSIWRRLNKVEAEMRGLEQRASQRSGTR